MAKSLKAMPGTKSMAGMNPRKERREIKPSGKIATPKAVKPAQYK